MAKYKVGDKVKIREDLKGYCEYGGVYSVANMEIYRGKIATITEVTKGRNYSIDLDKNLWIWSDDMFENDILTEKQFNDKISELEQQIAELKEQLEKKPDDKMPVGKIWRPKERETYYFNQCDGETDSFFQSYNLGTEEEKIISKIFISIGNCYPTEEKAKFEAQREKYTRLFRQYVEQHSEPLNWNNEDQIKYTLYYDHEEQKIDCWTTKKYYHLGNIYASGRKVLKEAIDFVGEDNVKKYILEIK